MELVIEPDGRIRAIYSEEIDLAALGEPSIYRASHVEPDPMGWSADLRPPLGPVRPFHRRARHPGRTSWLIAHWLIPTI